MPIIENSFFKITSVHRDDLEHAGFDTSQVDDHTMERLPAKWPMITVNSYFGIIFQLLLKLWVFHEKRSNFGRRWPPFFRLGFFKVLREMKYFTKKI